MQTMDGPLVAVVCGAMFFLSLSVVLHHSKDEGQPS